MAIFFFNEKDFVPQSSNAPSLMTLKDMQGIHWHVPVGVISSKFCPRRGIEVLVGILIT